MTCIFSVGGGPPAPGSGWDDPVTDGIEEMLGKENVILDGYRSHGLTRHRKWRSRSSNSHRFLFFSYLKNSGACTVSYIYCSPGMKLCFILYFLVILFFILLF